MGHPLDNFGGYNEVRDGLYAAGGNVTKFYNQISKNAVDKAAPRNRLEGGIIGLSLGASLIGSLWAYVERRKKRELLLAEKEAKLKKMLEEAMEDMPQESTIEDAPDNSTSP